jgi:hypothetical protein
MTALTAAKIDLVLLALQERQMRGAAPKPGEVTPEYLARLAAEIGEPVSAGTWRKIEFRAVAKLRHALSPSE